MTGALVEKVARAIGGQDWKNYSFEARAAILAVLEFYSDPENITPAHVVAFNRGWNTNIDPRYPALAAGLAAFMRAARDEVSRG